MTTLASPPPRQRRHGATPPPRSRSARCLVHIAPDAGVARVARDAARTFWRDQEATEFSEQVQPLRPPAGAGALDWIPHAALAGMGLAATSEHEWVTTTAVDEHADEAWGLTLLWVLENGGLQFRQRGARPVAPAVGDWLIVADRRAHEAAAVGAMAADGVFLAWAVRLREIA